LSADDRWAARYDACVNCGTTDRDHAGSGCCPRCRPVWLQKTRVERWDPSAPGALTKAPTGQLLKGRDDASPAILQLYKAEVLRQIGGRLLRLQREEWLRTGPITQMELEEELDRVWARIRPRPTHPAMSPFTGGATRIGRSFGREQMNAVAALLVDLTAHVPWRLDFSAWWQAVARPADEERLARSRDEGERRRQQAGREPP
jgi:hypothetical protein